MRRLTGVRIRLMLRLPAQAVGDGGSCIHALFPFALPFIESTPQS